MWKMMNEKYNYWMYMFMTASLFILHIKHINASNTGNYNFILSAFIPTILDSFHSKTIYFFSNFCPFNALLLLIKSKLCLD